MPADIWYGAECEIRVGRRADAATAPTSWQRLQFVQLTVNPTQEWRERPLLGDPSTRTNVLDPVRPRKGLFRLTAELTLDGDSRQLPLWLRYGLGAPAAAVAVGPLWSHVWSSGAKTEAYFDLQVRVGANDVRIYEGLTIGRIAAQSGGENTQDFDFALSLRGLNRRKVAAFEGSTPTACPAEAPLLRAQYLVDGVAASNTLSAGFSWDRALQEQLFLSSTPVVAGNRPNAGAAHTLDATFRAIGAVYDDMEAAGTVFAAALDYLGVVADHRVRLEQPNSLLQSAALPVAGPGVIERSWTSQGHQSGSAPGTRISVTNDVASYA